MSVTDVQAATRSFVNALTDRSNALVDRIERDAGVGPGDDARMWKPAADGWSLSELIEHLALVSNGMLRTERPTHARPFLMSAVKVSALRIVLRSPLRIPAPVSAIVPRAGISWSEARGDLIASNIRWSDFVERDDLDQCSFRHPLVGKLRSDETAGFLVEHFDHHTRQVDRIFSALRGRAK